MKLQSVILAAGILATAACSGNFSTGTQPNPLPPNAQLATPTPGATIAKASASATPMPSGHGVYPLADAPKGFACPETSDGFACLLRFNIPPATPAPRASKKPSPSPSPSPSPTPSPAGTGAPSASPSPAVPTITLHASALPKDAPAMVHAPKDALSVTALMMVTLTSTADFPLDGNAIAEFTLPKEQIGGRGYALQLFVQRMQGKTRAYAPVISLDKASLEKNVLTFGFTPPKITVAKATTYVLTLYAIDIAGATSTPAVSPTPTATKSP